LIFRALDAKRQLYSNDAANQDRFNFWCEVSDVFVTNSRKVLFDVFRGEEIEARRDPEKIKEIAFLKIKKHTYATLWFTMVPDITQYVYQILKGRRDFDQLRESSRFESNMEIRAKNQVNLSPSIFASKSSLYPYMQGYTSSSDKTSYFKYIPILTWTLENLFYYSRYAPECNPFIQQIVIPLLRLHKQYADEFLMMVHCEEEFYSSSNRFTSKREFNTNTPLKKSQEYCDFSDQLQRSINLGDYSPLNAEVVRGVKRTNLLFSIYRIEKLLDVYEIPDYFHTINHADMERALNAVNYLTKVYSVENVKAMLTNRMYTLATSPDFYDEELFEETYNEIMNSLDNLANINILTATDVINVKKEIDRPVQMRRETIARATT